MNKFKGKLLAVAAFASPILAIAEETGGSGTTSNAMATQATDVAESISEGFTAVISGVTPFVNTVILGGLGIFATILVVRILKRAFRTGS